jgi:hypothetical protein
MIRIDLSYFYRLGANIAAVNRLRYDVPMREVRHPLQAARTWLAAVAQDTMFGSGLRGSKVQLGTLAIRLDALLGRDDDSQFSFSDLLEISGDLNRFETVLNSELSIADAYYVLEKKPYSTITLVTEGESLFPPNILDKVPEAATDLREAGKCLAFEVPTAAAFHVHRAAEAVLRKYWEAVTGNAPKPKARSIGVYLAAMKKLKCGDEKVIAALTQMTELHRNPTIHPGELLDMPEAIALVGIANSVVAAMLKEMPDVTEDQPDLLDWPPQLSGFLPGDG